MFIKTMDNKGWYVIVEHIFYNNVTISNKTAVERLHVTLFDPEMRHFNVSNLKINTPM